MIDIKVHPGCTWRGHSEVSRYMQEISKRKEKYPALYDPDLFPYAFEVDRDGYSKIESFFDKRKLLRIKEEFNIYKSNFNLQYDDLYTEQVAHPLVNIPSVFDVVFDDKILLLASQYFGCLPTLNNVQLRISKQTNLSEHQLPGNGQTTIFHCDKDSPRFLKAFFYLDDVGPRNGPFTYVHGSHMDKFSGWKQQNRWPDDQIEKYYGQDRIINLTGEVGDLIIANTNGFHKGKKIEDGQRMLLTAYYSVHPSHFLPEYGGRIRKLDFDRLPESKRPVADYLNKV